MKICENIPQIQSWQIGLLIHYQMEVRNELPDKSFFGRFDVFNAAAYGPG
jgi:hypothetical protein